MCTKRPTREVHGLWLTSHVQLVAVLTCPIFLAWRLASSALVRSSSKPDIAAEHLALQVSLSYGKRRNSLGSMLHARRFFLTESFVTRRPLRVGLAAVRGTGAYYPGRCWEPEDPLDGRHPNRTFLGKIYNLLSSGLAQGERDGSVMYLQFIYNETESAVNNSLAGLPATTSQ